MSGARVLVTGAAGMLGSQLLIDAPADVEALGTDLRGAPEGGLPVEAAGVDLLDRDRVEVLLDELGPFHGVIHAAAYTQVDKAEEEWALALSVNGHVPAVLAEACRRREIPLVLVSTDFVFDGRRGEPYREEDPPSPEGAYGITKWKGERWASQAYPGGVRVVRTQWLYGPRGSHFPGVMARLAVERDAWAVVDDQRGAPTSTLELAPALWDVWRRGESGVYHAACSGETSWHGFAVAIVERLGLNGDRVRACSTKQYEAQVGRRLAPRPPYSVLSCERLTRLRGQPLRGWEEALGAFLKHQAAARTAPAAAARPS